MVSLGCWFDTWFIRVLFFFFKQKTAYELRISDWSSDVCSSDLTVIRYRGKSAVRDVAKAFGLPPDQVALLAECHGWGNGETPMEQRLREAGFAIDNPLIARVLAVTDMLRGRPRHLSQHVGGRSEEHTSELTSLMRNSYAVFCLKKTHYKPPHSLQLNDRHCNYNITHT